MSLDCCSPEQSIKTNDNVYRKTLWVVLVINAVMFFVEIISGIAAGSVSLQADSLDFLGDAANYGVALYVLTKSLRLKAYSALAKSFTMFGFGLWVITQAVYKMITGIPPQSEIMGVISIFALAANMLCFYLLSRHSREDSNRKSVWLCSRNDAIGNIAVMLAAAATHYTLSHWPDLIVALMMALLAISSAWQVAKHALNEIRHT
jgi:cation diffusion facilitator family transporter